MNRNKIAVGDIDGYVDPQGQERSGRVTRLIDKTVSLAVGDQHRRVAYCFLHRVMQADIVEAVSRTELEYGNLSAERALHPLTGSR